ncbi:hypothetical protein T484DRAFT_1885714 [Baffinella frigidus]|nr:hypothetical protein T484DRAFT_1885714 [Cryptophyta sp. CCMP2293]|mmetsp:Transcript_29422/g.70056  ORF Transcript_29422/g.70056 Transcript_29422/m.70056 type:complete len:153 (+) Transcript_29422:115-573(+)
MDMVRALRGGGVVRLATREVQRMAKNKKTGKASDNSGQDKKQTGKNSAHMQRFINFFESPIPKKYIRSAEQMALDEVIAKEYNRQMFKMHNRWSVDCTMKIKLRDSAIASLPVELQEEANTHDMALFPLDRHVFTEWPAIKDFEKLKTAGKA